MQVPGMEDNIILIDSVSKRYSMCGARVGFIVSRNKEFMPLVLKYAQARLCCSKWGQIAALAALDTPQEYFDEVKKEYLKRRQILAAQKPVNESEEIHAPMPGKIVNVLVAAGQEVQPGDAILVLEAMKMQNTLTATSKGTISKIDVKIGQTVSKDDLLVEIKR